MSSNTDGSDDRGRDQSKRTADEGTAETESRSSSIADSARGQTRGEQSMGGTGEMAGRAFDSARNRLSSPAAKSQLKYVVGVFALVGAGFGITGFLIIELLTGGDSMGAQLLTGVFSIALLTVVLLIGPVVAVYSGLDAADGLHNEPRTAYLTSFVGNFAGYLVTVLIAVLLIGAAVGGGSSAQTSQDQLEGTETAQNTGGNTLDIANLLVPMILLSIPVGLVGLGSTYLHRGRSAPTQAETTVSK